MKRYFKPAIFSLVALLLLTLLSTVAYADGECTHESTHFERTDGDDATTHSEVCDECSYIIDSGIPCDGGEQTCTESAICSACGEAYKEPHGHMWDISGVDHPLSFNATVHYKTCFACGVVLDSSMTNHTYGEWVETLAPTESSTGMRERSCTACDYKQVVVLEKLCYHSIYHYERTSDDSSSAHSIICDGCGIVISGGVSCFGGESTCTKRAVCICCEKEYGELPVGHIWNVETLGRELSYNDIFHYDKCVTCGASRTESERDHEYGAWRVTLSPTEENAGERSRSCEACGYKQLEVIPQLEKESHVGLIVFLVVFAALVVGVGVFLLVWLLYHKRTMGDLWECIAAIATDIKNFVMRILTSIANFVVITFKRVQLLLLKVRVFFTKTGRRIKGFFQTVALIFGRCVRAIKNLFVK